MLTSGCGKDFLEKPAGGSVTVDTIFHTKNQARSAVARMYQECLYGDLAWTASDNCARPDAITDQVYISGNTNWIMGAFGGGSYYSGTMTASATPDRKKFGGHYLGIRRANLVLKNIDKVTDADADWINDQKGQAMYCKAWQHFQLFRFYGGIPIVDDVLGEGNVKIARRSVKAVVDYIVDLCDKAAAVLPESRGAADYGRVTKLAALALKARVLLYAASPLYNTPPSMASTVSSIRYKDSRDSVLCYPDYDVNRWKLAADAAKAVLDNAPAAGVALYKTGNVNTTGDSYASLGDYEAVWNVYGNSEVILCNTQRWVNSWSSDGSIWALYGISKVFSQMPGFAPSGPWGIMNHTPIEFATCYEKQDGTPWTLKLTDTGNDLPAYIQGLNLDPRFYQSICYDGMVYNTTIGQTQYYTAGGGYSAGKLAVNDQSANGFSMEAYKYTPRIENGNLNHFTWPFFRLAEFYLSYAEALNEFNGGPTAEAYSALNEIRSRVGMPAKSGLNQDAFRKAVLNERNVEFAFENLRYNDLLRTLTAHTVLNGDLHGFKTTAAKSPSNTLWRTWRIDLLGNRIFPMKYYYLPFPNEEISMLYLGGSRNWDGQNPGW